MTEPAGRTGSPSAEVRTRYRVLTSAVLAATLGTTLSVAGTAALLAAAPWQPPPLDIGTVAPATPGSPSAADTDAAPPVLVSADTIGLRSSLTSVHIEQDGHLGTPSDPDKAGWWSEGPAPGDPGAAVIVGHVDSRTGPAIFHDLSSLRPGDKIVLDREDGSAVTFTVRALRQYPKDEIPDDQVYALDGPPSLRLITCGGTYDRDQGGYSDNLVVYADLSSTSAQETRDATRGPAPSHRNGQ